MKFKKFLMIYIGILVVLSAIFLIYVHNCLVNYERAQINNYVSSIEQDWIKSAKKGKISKHITSTNAQISK